MDTSQMSNTKDGNRVEGVSDLQRVRWVSSIKKVGTKMLYSVGGNEVNEPSLYPWTVSKPVTPFNQKPHPFPIHLTPPKTPSTRSPEVVLYISFDRTHCFLFPISSKRLSSSLCLLLTNDFHRSWIQGGQGFRSM